MTQNHTFVVLTPRCNGSIEARINALSRQLHDEILRHTAKNETLVWARVFLSDIINQLPCIKSSVLGQMLDTCAFSCVEQPPLDGSKIAIMAYFATNSRIETLTPDAKRIITPQGSFIYHSVRFETNEIDGMNGKEQTILAFEKHKALLASHGMHIAANTLRTWLFVRDIDNFYADVVCGRNDFFARNGLTSDTHFIASTGICGYSDNPKAIVAVDFLSQENLDADNVKYLHAPNFLNATSEYGVAFERGTTVHAGGETFTFISGTASIDRYGNCIHINDPKSQTERLVTNIEALLADAGQADKDVKMLIVYLRDPSDRDIVAEVIKDKLPGTPMILTQACVCRPQWLVEAECIAYNAYNARQ